MKTLPNYDLGIHAQADLGFVKIMDNYLKYYTMQVNPLQEPTITDILTELRNLKTEVDQRLDKLEYKFDTYEKASDKVVRLATTIIIAAATVAVLLSAFQVIRPLLTQLITAG